MSAASVVIQLAEALSALSIPLGGGLAAYIKWRKGAERDRRSREEAARLASEKAAADARREETGLRNELIKEKDARIASLEKDLIAEKAETAQLHRYIQEMLRTGQFKPTEGV